MTLKLKYISAGFLAVLLSQTALAESFKFHQDHVLGTSFDMVVDAPNIQQAQKIKSETLAEIKRLEKILSTWSPQSEISKLNKTGAKTVSSELFYVLKSCEIFSAKTDGAFSCRMDELIKTWQAAEINATEPSHERTQQLALKAEATVITLTRQTSSVTKPIDFNFNIDGIAKGYIIDKALQAGIRSAQGQGLSGRFGIVLDIGGDIAVHGLIDNAHARVGILGVNAADNSAPVETLVLKDQAIATSGSGKRDLKVGARSYSHIISPFTGRPQLKTQQVSVVAPKAETADALATAFSTMGVATALSYANTHEGVETMIITAGGARFTSKHWKDLTAKTVKKSAAEAGIANPLPKGFSVNIAYKIPRINVSDYEYPYVVVWVTDMNKKLVRSLTMIGKQPLWVEENYVFWRRVGRKFPAMVETLAQPSRAPGQYNLVWDGYDQEGNPVPQGEYILHIEASREHGGHQYVKQTLNLGDDIFEAIIDSGDELGQIDIHYGKDH